MNVYTYIHVDGYIDRHMNMYTYMFMNVYICIELIDTYRYIGKYICHSADMKICVASGDTNVSSLAGLQK